MKRTIFTLLLSFLVTFSAVQVNAQTKLTHSASETIDPGMRYLCMYKYYSSWSGLWYFYYQFKQSYQRVFDMTSLGLTDTVDAVSLQIGILETKGTAGTQTLNANVYTLSGSFVYANMTKVASGSTDIGNITDSLVTIQLEGRIPGGTICVAEFEIPQGTTYDSVRCYAGFNGLPQTDKTYYSAWAWSTYYGCYYNDPLDFASLGAPYTNYHIIMNLLVNQKPEVDDVNVTAYKDSFYAFDAGDFDPSAFTDADGDPLEMIKILSLPKYGWLKYKGAYVLPGDTVWASSMSDLVYEPTRAFTGLDQFDYIGSDGLAWSNDPATVNIQVIKLGSSVEDIAFANNINVYPNPTMGMANVVVDTDGNDPMKVTLFNINGQVINQFIIDNDNFFQINLSDLPKGLYNMQLEQGSRVAVKSIIRQ